MTITGITAQVKNNNRVNVLVDGVYRFSLDIFQVGELGIKVGREYSDEQLQELETESQFGKLYARALEYCLMRPHSAKEVRDYLYRKTRPTRTKSGELRDGVSVSVAERVFDRLQEKNHINDEAFAGYWIENRRLSKGVSRRKLTAELRAKGVLSEIIEQQLARVGRDEVDELQKVISKKAGKYTDQQKFIHYLAGQGFSFEDIKAALATTDA